MYVSDLVQKINAFFEYQFQPKNNGLEMKERDVKKTPVKFDSFGSSSVTSIKAQNLSGTNRKVDYFLMFNITWLFSHENTPLKVIIRVLLQPLLSVNSDLWLLMQSNYDLNLNIANSGTAMRGHALTEV